MIDLNRPTWVEVDLTAARQNLINIKKHAHANKVIAVLKANAYGNGAVRLAQFLTKDIDQIAVATLDEALELQNSGIKLPIWVLGAQELEVANTFADHGITITTGELDWLKQVEDKILSENKLLIALSIDTGMNRIGFKDKGEIKEALDFISQSHHLKLQEVYTHFSTADSDDADDTYFKFQVQKWHQLIDGLDIPPETVSMANSATAVWHADDQGVDTNKIRIGIAFSGLNPSDDNKPLPDNLQLTPTFSMYTKITDVRLVKKSESISYGANYQAPNDQWIATVPIGYADGWLRRMSDSYVMIEDKKLSIAGRITMDQMMIILDQKYPIGTKVTIMNKQLTASDHAKNVGTIGYEILTSISQRVPRIYIN